MNRTSLLPTALLLVLSPLPFLLLPESMAAPAAAAYDVVVTRVMYLPDAPFHITDTRTDAQGRCNFETRTVQILQPYQNGEALQDRPVVFFVHGGGWTEGYAEWYTDILTPALTVEQGWVVVNVDYRLTSGQVYHVDGEADPCNPVGREKAAWYDDNLQDVAAAFQWTRENIAAYGGDPRNIFLFGHSAGGHLVSLLATHEDYRNERPFMRGVISLSGAYDLKNLSAVFDLAIAQTFRGGRTNQAALDDASPLLYVQGGEIPPPFYLLYCELDLPSLPEQAAAFYDQLEAGNYDVLQTYLEGYDHVGEMEAVADGQETVTQDIVAYITARVREDIFLPVIFQTAP